MIQPDVLRVGFQDQKHQDHPKRVIPEIGDNGAIDEFVKIDQHIDNRSDPEEGEEIVIPEDSILKSFEGWKDQEGKEENEHDMNPPQDLGGENPHGGIEMDERHDHGHNGDKSVHLP